MGTRQLQRLGRPAMAVGVIGVRGEDLQVQLFGFGGAAFLMMTEGFSE